MIFKKTGIGESLNLKTSMKGKQTPETYLVAVLLLGAL